MSSAQSVPGPLRRNSTRRKAAFARRGHVQAELCPVLRPVDRHWCIDRGRDVGLGPIPEVDRQAGDRGGAERLQPRGDVVARARSGGDRAGLAHPAAGRVGGRVDLERVRGRVGGVGCPAEAAGPVREVERPRVDLEAGVGRQLLPTRRGDRRGRRRQDEVGWPFGDQFDRDLDRRADIVGAHRVLVGRVGPVRDDVVAGVGDQHAVLPGRIAAVPVEV